MRKFPALLRSAKFIHAVHIGIIVAAIIFVPSTAVQTVRVIHAHSHHPTKPAPTPVVAVVAKHPSLHPAPPAPAPAPQASPTPAPAPVAPPVAAPQPVVHTNPAPKVVAATGAAPGSSVHTLTPAPAPSSSTSSTSGSTSSTSGTSSTTSSSTSTNSPPSGGTSSSTATELSNPDYTSYNWAGYMADTATYSAVSGAWTVPTPTGNGSSTTADAAWIGIGGISTNDLIQVGSEDTVSASGTVSAAVFYELLPASPIYPVTINISPGDHLSASLAEQSPGTWLITMSDSTNSQSFSTTVSYTSSHSSAEWIEEDPMYSNGQLVPFDNFNTISFADAQTTANSTSQTIATANGASIALVTQSGTTVAGPTALGTDGTSFSVIHN